MHNTLTLLILLSLLTTLHADDTIIKIKNGLIQGDTTSLFSNVRYWKGIPYAEPPVGALRFMPPEPYSITWEGIRKFTEFGDDCPQGTSGMSDRPQSEDCLFLNVWAPRADVIKAPIPVMVWFYGGCWTQGSDSYLPYDGANIINHGGEDVVIVTSNYRLGPLGFLGGYDFKNVTRDGSTGNMGLQDQRLVMQWVQENIAAFGGDPNQVTIFGESAGAASISDHMVMPKSRGLFQKAIMESGTFSFWVAQFLDEANVQYDVALKHLKCDSYPSPSERIACLQGFDWKTINSLPLPREHYPCDVTPTVDLVELLDHPVNLVRDGKFARVPVLFGTNANEGTLLYNTVCDIENGKHANPDNYKGCLKSRYKEGDWAERIYNEYPPSDYKNTSEYSSSWEALTYIVTDGYMSCAARRSARWLTNGGQPIYLYHFTHVIDVIKYFRPSYGVFHGSDLAFVWDIKSFTYDGTDLPILLSLAERDLQQTFVSYWTSFARTGNPNSQSGYTPVIWPRYDNTTDLNLILDLEQSVQVHLKEKKCDFWDEYFHDTWQKKNERIKS
eukprot:TRINITY_DN4438_c0_g1_i1.p1 TRINITY_DN4438_c0_g1~~TRINITY_DN4438_c0_g1_i1.p1  ORF type:complete len:564 (-),score=93.61 TRINITY_DN4438_c0_g1_i1:2-1669(-)